MDSKCLRPSIRIEWRKLSNRQKIAYHNAVKCTKEKASRISSDGQSKSTLEDFTYVHLKLRKSVHHVASFLPWHRWFLAMYASELESCGYTDTMPYWDWTRDSGTIQAFINSEIFHPVHGFGSLGITEGCVEDGPYAGMQPNLPKPHCLKRGFNLSITEPGQWTASNARGIMRYSDFLNLWNKTERRPHLPLAVQQLTMVLDTLGLLHDKVHNAIGGDMLEHYSPNDPLFYLHHAQIDRIWTLWQGRNKTRISDYTGNAIQNATTNMAGLGDIMTVLGLAQNRTVESVMDTQASGLCYTYDDEGEQLTTILEMNMSDQDVIAQ
ncbi:tyrosinase [Rhizoctonia solani]|uniref:Tyrosinase n=1 Tax=Rhizoctonia solani TaxID=456999 RepID=A0A8H8SX22_9AGAM|nr:tyrosinase [Rhizoctonia solani]QRW21114.1 tyrosinase [Rhizoctonia solani]